MKTAIVTDSNSGFTREEAEKLGLFVLPMPFTIDGEEYLEGETLSHDVFYEKQVGGSSISTAQPSPGSVTDLWDQVLAEYDELVHIPMSSGLSGSCETAIMLSKEEEYDGRVFVADNQRVSVPLKHAIYDALSLREIGKTANEIRDCLEMMRKDSYVYVIVSTMEYLKKGGRVTPAAAALGTLLKIKPVLLIHGVNLDSFAKARTFKHAKQIMVDAIHDNIEKFFGGNEDDVWIEMAYTKDEGNLSWFHDEIAAAFPNHDILMDPLPLSLASHLGPGVIGVAVTKRMKLPA